MPECVCAQTPRRLGHVLEVRSRSFGSEDHWAGCGLQEADFEVQAVEGLLSRFPGFLGQAHLEAFAGDLSPAPLSLLSPTLC